MSQFDPSPQVGWRWSAFDLGSLPVVGWVGNPNCGNRGGGAGDWWLVGDGLTPGKKEQWCLEKDGIVPENLGLYHTETGNLGLCHHTESRNRSNLGLSSPILRIDLAQAFGFHSHQLEDEIICQEQKWDQNDQPPARRDLSEVDPRIVLGDMSSLKKRKNKQNLSRYVHK